MIGRNLIPRLVGAGHEVVGMTGDAATNRVRTEGTRNLIDAAELAGTPAMVAQSYCIYAPGSGLADESDPLDVNSPVFGAAAAALAALEGAGSRRTH